MAEVAQVTSEHKRVEPPQETAIRRLMEVEREALDRSLDRLGDKLSETLDWRRQVARHQGKLLAAVGGVALLGAWRWTRRRSPAERAAAVVVSGAREVTEQACEAIASLSSLVSVRRRVPKLVMAPLVAAAVRAAAAWWDREPSGDAHRPPAQEGGNEEESWRLERRMR